MIYYDALTFEQLSEMTLEEAAVLELATPPSADSTPTLYTNILVSANVENIDCIYIGCEAETIQAVCVEVFPT